MSEREDNRAWLRRGMERRPDGWEAEIVELYGEEGALDMLAVQAGNHLDANLTRRPFNRDPELKYAIRKAREASKTMSQLAYERWWWDKDRAKALRDATESEATYG